MALLNVWTYNGMLENLSSTYIYTVPSGGGTVTPVTGSTAPIQVDLGVVKQQANLTLVNHGTSGYTTASGVPTTTNGSGVGLTLNITASGGVVTAGQMANQAKGYQVGDKVYPVQAGSSADAYFTIAYAVATNDYGGVASTITGPQNIPFKKVTGTPIAGEYAFNAGTGAYTFAAADAGATVAISYSSMFSLYYLVQTQFDLVPSSTPFQITPDNHGYFYADLGVTFIDTNTAGVLVSGTPSAPGEYQESIGFYNFYSGDAGRPVAIKYSYTSSDPTISSSSVLNLTFFNGAQSQAPWSYTESANPSHAFGYTLTCYVASENLDLGQTAQMPPYNYEVAGQAIYPGQQDCLITDVMTLVLSDPFCGIDFPSSALDTTGTWPTAIAHWLANGFFISDVLEASVGIADLLKRYCDAGNTAAFFSGGLLKLVPYSEVSAAGNGAVYTPPTTPVAALSWGNVLLPSGQKPGNTISDDYIPVDEVAAVDKYNYVQANFAYRANSYNNNLINQQNDAMIALYRRRMESAQDWKFITLPAAAQWALSCRLSRGLYVDKKFKVSLPYTFDFLEPMDVLVSPTGISFRITKITEDENQEQQIEAENFVFGGSSASIYPVQAPTSYQPTQSAASPGSTVPGIWQSTTYASGQLYNVINIAAGGENANFGGCQIWLSVDGTTYSLIGTINENCAVGVLSAALAASPDPDTTDTLSVDMSPSGVQLVAASQAVADSFGTLSALISASNPSKMEFIAYANCTLTAANRYNLTYLRRGVYGTPISAFGAGDFFCYIGSSSIFQYQFPLSYFGKQIFLKFPAFNHQQQAIQPLSQCAAYPVTVGLQGSSIVETYVPSTYSVTQTGTGTVYNNPTQAYDRDFGTAASFSSGTANGSITITYSGFGSGLTTQPMMLNVNYSDYHNSGTDFGPLTVSMAYALTTGATPTVFWQDSIPIWEGQTTTAANGTASVSIPAGTDLSQLSVQFFLQDDSGHFQDIDINEIWLQ